MVGGPGARRARADFGGHALGVGGVGHFRLCLLYTSDAADERSSVDLGGRRILQKKKKRKKKKEKTKKKSAGRWRTAMIETIEQSQSQERQRV